MLIDLQKIDGCLLGGAIGDAFGAPVEGIMRLSDIRKTFGENGQQEFTPYKSFFNDAERTGLGVITDDTTMLACTLAGIVDALNGQATEKKLLDDQWKFYLAWGACQSYGQDIADFSQKAVDIPEYLQPFMFVCGAGRGTMAGLLQGDYGTLDKPQSYRMMIGDRLVESPNRGCGAMMRIAPLAFLAPEYDVLALARQNAAMTHGHHDAMNAAALTALMVQYAWQTGDLAKVLHDTKAMIGTLPEHDGVYSAWQMAEDYHKKMPDSMDAINDLGYMFKPQNPFTALPVFAQVVYTLHQAAGYTPDTEHVKQIMRLAVNHAGDSDSVGAIIGNIVGAAWGQNALPKDWVDLVMCKDDILNLGKVWHQTALSQRHLASNIHPFIME